MSSRKDHQKLCKLIRENIPDEYKGRGKYHEMAMLARKMGLHNLLDGFLSSQNDETKHRKRLVSYKKILHC